MESRTGDTRSLLRAKQEKRLPTALVTTPESLALLLARPEAREQFSHLHLVIVDEWHELMGTKRGVLTELELARLRALESEASDVGAFRHARQSAYGGRDAAGESGRRCPHRARRRTEDSAHRFPAAGAHGPLSLGRPPRRQHAARRCSKPSKKAPPRWSSPTPARNARSGIRRFWTPVPTGPAPSPSTTARSNASFATGWKTGCARVRCAAWSALRAWILGVDFSPVDRVIQIGSPKGVARLLQRAGRSGHRPGVTSRITCAPTHAFELVEVAAARDAYQAGAIESRFPVERPLDLLAQHAVTIALGGGFRAEELLAEVRTTHAYRDLDDIEWQWVLDFITRGGEALRAYPEYQRVDVVDGVYQVTNRQIARRHLLSIGTIVADAVHRSPLRDRRPAGQRGRELHLAAAARRSLLLRGQVSGVRAGPQHGGAGAESAWRAGRRAPLGRRRMPLSSELAEAVRDAPRTGAARRVSKAKRCAPCAPCSKPRPTISAIPGRDELLIERVETREGHHLFFYPFEGRLVHEGLAALFAWRISQTAARSRSPWR